MSARIQFQGSIDLNEVERALLVMQALIAKAQYDGEVVVMGKLATLAIKNELAATGYIPVENEPLKAPSVESEVPE